MAPPVTDGLPHPVWSGTFTIAGVALRCHTLSDGARIIEERSVHALLTALEKPSLDPDVDTPDDSAAFNAWRAGRDAGD